MHNSSVKTHSSRLIRDFIQRLGFGSDAAKLYLSLLSNGPQTLLEASRSSGLERTKLYRLTESLIEKGLIEEIPAYKRRTIKAADLNTIELLAKEKDRESKLLLSSFPTLTEAINTISQKVPENNVVYYHGSEGIKTMTWHVLDCVGIYRTYSTRFWDDILGPRFVLKLNQEMIARHFQVRDIYSDQYFDFKKWWYQTGHKQPAGNWSFWDSRYVPERILKVDWNLDIYNNVVAYYYWQGEETFGFEIHNPRFALMQKQIHDTLWKMAKKRPEIDWTKKKEAIYP